MSFSYHRSINFEHGVQHGKACSTT